jgi:hypothetical protein
VCLTWTRKIIFHTGNLVPIKVLHTTRLDRGGASRNRCTIIGDGSFMSLPREYCRLSRRGILAPSSPYSPFSSQQFVSLSQSSCVSHGRGWRGRSQIIRRQKSLVLYKSFISLCPCQYLLLFVIVILRLTRIPYAMFTSRSKQKSMVL